MSIAEPRAGDLLETMRALSLLLAALLLAIVPASAEEQSWAKRTPPPVKYAPQSPEQKEHDWSGFHMGVNAGSGFGANNRDSPIPGNSTMPR
jgi:hypothetical protein